ncbi:sigma-54-dependent Fis family transcriptional regulator [Coralloluteibacterium stylophorae]|uniref:Sigma-54-dependent Fis family transcriptional regulator n=1 Tax=Coralloluteibacterium stylophorae TaxID=1776034 RepID=A0A8J7VSD1_9GAMM|nr:sigma-54-dependent Fis family transcriptional regulator [Coralloluteibacterium stylophorae]MBS7457860.1 sigma-54-dependent Fis family transcriptional regulator [Coralloluteibacterium stylophorae]
MTAMHAPYSRRMLGLIRERTGSSNLPTHVARSWSRCLEDFGLEPGGRRAAAVLEAAAVRARQERFGALLDVARAEMESLYEQIAGSGYAVILSDADATILATLTDPALKREFLHAGLWDGALWDERHEGTNGLGTCVAEGKPVIVHRGEHFHDWNVHLTCAGAPILGVDGRVMAVLDASSANATGYAEHQRHTMALVKMSADLIARCHFMRSQPDAWIMRLHSRPEFVGLLHEALIAVDERGVVCAVNDSALLQLGVSSRSCIVGRPIETVFPFRLEAMARRAATAPSTLWPVRDLAHGRRFFAKVRGPLREEPMRSAGAVRAGCRTGAPPVPAPHEPVHVDADPKVRDAMHRGRQLFARRIPILLQGATGTGKEAFAKALHRSSAWADKPFVAVNCAAIPEALIESELFGYQRGAFTDAAREGRPGRIQQSSGGTLFLDEIGDMPLMLQTRLLRVLEEHEVVPLGGDRAQLVDLHVISASHQDLLRMVEAGTFREDLYYRLNGITLRLPALRERADKRELIQALLREECPEDEPVVLSRQAMDLLLAYGWPGNVRQLRNALRMAAALCADGLITPSNLPQEIVDAAGATSEPAGGDASPLNLAERDALLRELERMRWNISHTAEALGVSRNTLYRKIRKHDIALPD